MILIYTLTGILFVSLISLVGILTLFFKKKKLEKILIYLVSLSIGTLLGGSFIHLVPESLESGLAYAPVLILLGILLFFILEKAIHWRHCHEVACDDHPHAFSYMILFGDALHNFIDGALIAASFMTDLKLGITTTVAVIFHEIPQEIGDFGSLIYAGFSKAKALFYNFISSLTAFLGAILILVVGGNFSEIIKYLVPITAGGFIYIAMIDLVPEIQKTRSIGKFSIQFLFVIIGVCAMMSLSIFE